MAVDNPKQRSVNPRTRAAIGKRVLAKIGSAIYSSGPPTEIRVLEIAPSGEYVRIEFLTGVRRWENAEAVSVIEELPSNHDPYSTPSTL